MTMRRKTGNTSKVITFFRATMFIILVTLFPRPCLLAQTTETNDYTWDLFAEDFLNTYESSDEEEIGTEVLERLEEIHLHPFDINTVSREDLSQLSFLSEEKIDSLLSYRQRKGRFYDLGELMFLPRLTMADRQQLSLFLTCRMPEKKQKTTFAEQLFRGQHEAETRLDIPLYRRDGYREHTVAELQSNPNAIYQGNALHHTLRYRYHYAKSVRYGLTLDKGAGEPFALFDNYPYDFVSAYFQVRLEKRNLLLIAGDYRLQTGQGLLVGNAYFTSGYYEVTSPQEPRTKLLPHTSTSSSGFFRGAAVQKMWKNLEIMGFLSYRRLDARLQNDTVRSFITNGYHRTLSEIEQKNNVGAFTAGGRLGYRNEQVSMGFNLIGTHYDRPVQPSPSFYNQYYFSGKDCLGFSVDYYWNAAKFSVKGEMALDGNFHFAWTNWLHYRPNEAWLLTLGTRYFGKQFHSLHGKTTAKSNRLQNEQAVALGLSYKGGRRWNVSGYAEAFRFPSPVYRNHQSTMGFEVRLNGVYTLNKRLKANVSYRMRAQEYDITDFPDIKEYITTHRFALNLTHSAKRWNSTATIGATYYRPQATDESFGWLAALRSACTLSQHFSFALFGSVFLTKDNNSAISIYTPQLRNMTSLMQCSYKGFATVVTANYQAGRHLQAGVRLGTVHYFNKNSISSGLQEIPSSWQNDLSLQLSWRF